MDAFLHLEWKSLYFDSNFAEAYFQGSNWRPQAINIFEVNSQGSNWWHQAITLANINLSSV